MVLGIPCHSLNVHEETVLRGEGGKWMRKTARHPAGACEVPAAWAAELPNHSGESQQGTTQTCCQHGAHVIVTP